MWEYYEGKSVLDTVNKFYDTKCLVVLDGDILLPNLGLLQSELDMIRDEVHIIIHAASYINLGSALKRVSDPIIGGSEMMANLALTCKRLNRFIYVFSAYSTAHLYPRSPDPDVKINEEIYEPERQSYVLDELNEHYFSVRAAEKKLLIVRPGVIEPAQHFPFPGYNMPMSSPITMAVAAFALALTREVRIATKMDDPDSRVTIDEVPVDVVADRLLCHLAMGTSGCIHAVSGVRSRLKFGKLSNSLMKLRRIPASFNFSEDKTSAMFQKLSEEEQQDLQLFTQIDISEIFSLKRKPSALP
ncbi:male sterility protein-domain-containing protein [Aspergillus sergii]|uniref:Fatty acyl-CoA reductase n=1 Tax=Aspergillus sergii TaxID=1034303 RepID=A0A5N6XA37_9EURO|nr:male sterility protein-domain-containing protein [Aspergillus sergii]